MAAPPAVDELWPLPADPAPATCHPRIKLAQLPPDPLAALRQQYKCVRGCFGLGWSAWMKPTLAPRQTA